MQTLRKITLVLGLLLMTACSAAAPANPTATIVPAPQATLDAAPSPVIMPTLDPAAPLPQNARLDGPQIDFETLHLTLPAGLAGQVTANLIPRVDGEGMPYWAIYPEHPQVTLDGYELQGTVLQPRVEVYPVAEYEAINDSAARQIAALRRQLDTGSRAADDPLPVLPPLNATQVLRARIEELSFQGGHGLRYLTQHDQNLAPINNGSLFYTFQGLTDDGAYYISAIFPVAAPFLPEGYGPAPEGGVPFPNPNVDGFMSQLPAYFAAVTQRLEDLQPQEFTPDLALLDQLATSIQVRR